MGKNRQKFYTKYHLNEMIVSDAVSFYSKRHFTRYFANISLLMIRELFPRAKNRETTSAIKKGKTLRREAVRNGRNF